MTTNHENSRPEQPERPDRRPSAPVSDGLELILKLLFLALFGLLLIAFIVWQGSWRQGVLVSSRPIGGFIRMSGPGGLQERVVIETSTGSYPLRSAAVISKGTPLVLDLHRSGARYVCDVPRTLCIQTLETEFSLADSSLKTNAEK
jgi:hypothetical protein